MSVLNRISWPFAAPLILALGLAWPAPSQVVALRNIAGGLESPSVADATYGWRFTVDLSADLSVTHLGFLDMNASGFLEEHRVGIWDSSDNLVTELTFGAGESGVLDNGFRYLPVAAQQTLQAGQSYSIGSWNLGASDNAIVGAQFGTEYADEIDYLGAGYSQASGFAPPKNNAGLAHGYFGPNFKFQLVPVPEPREYALATAAALLAAALLRRQLLR